MDFPSVLGLNRIEQIGLFLNMYHSCAFRGSVFASYRGDDGKWHNTKAKDVKAYYSKEYRDILANSTNDEYISINEFIEDAQSKDAASVSVLNGFLIDLDIHGADLTEEDKERRIEQAYNRLNEMIAAGELLRPSLFVFSGRGFQLHYLFGEKVTPDEAMKQLHTDMLTWFAQKMDGLLEVDYSIVNFDRVCRIAGTYNTKAKRYSVLLDCSGFPYGVEQLRSFFAVTDAERRLAKPKKSEPKAQKATSKKKKTNAKAINQGESITMPKIVKFVGKYERNALKYRMRNLRKLAEMRDNISEGCRNNWCLIYYHSAVQLYDLDTAMNMTLELAAILRDKSAGEFTDDEIYHYLEVYSVRRNKEAQGILVDGCGKPIAAEYHYSDGRIIDLLEITNEEITDLGIGATAAAKEKREENKKKALEQDKKIAKMWLDGVSYRQIAVEIGVNKSTVQRAIKRMGINDRSVLFKAVNFEACQKRQGQSVKVGAEVIVPFPSSLFAPDMEKKSRILFLGKAGTGKSTEIEKIKKSAKHPLVLAPTGKAADNVQGLTIHSALSIPIGTLIGDEDIDVSALKDVDVIIVDEVGAVRVDLFDYIYRLVSKAEQTYQRTIRVVMVGDFGQLAPVLPKTNAELFQMRFRYGCRKGYCFEGKHFKEWFTAENTYLLTESKRQAGDMELVGALDAAYVGDGRIAAWFNEHIDHMADDTALTICGLNKSVDAINGEKAAAYLTGKKHRTYALETSEGEIYQQELAVGMPVMFTKNKSGWKNGTLAHIERLNRKGVSAIIDATGERVVVQYDNDKSCLPFMLAYAVTIHKAQGMTMEKVNIKVDDFFADGMAYVALSRCKSREGMHLLGDLLPGHIKANKDALALMGMVQKEQKDGREKVAV